MSKKPFVIGITGGVGSGKSCVLELIQELCGARLLLADQIAHDLMEPGKPGYQAVVQALGVDFLADDGTIDRKRLAELIFGKREARKTVDGIIHPMVWKEICHEIRNAEEAVVVVEAALPDEKVHDIYDEMWYVYTSRENRISRLMKGRGYTREKCEAIMESQLPDEEFRKMCQTEIDNNGSLEDVRKQVAEKLKSRGLTT